MDIRKSAPRAAQSLEGERISDYVAELQFHMTLQARNLVPTLSTSVDSRHELLHQAQAQVEKLASRQIGR